MRKIYSSFIILLLCCTCTNAQVSITATAGTAGPTAYTTLKSAFDAINAGTHQGSITVNITANTIETASAVLNASGSGTSSYTSVMIKPSGGATRVITGDIAGPLVSLDGADNVNINGLNTANDSLIISNTNISGSANNAAVQLINDASNNTITKTTLLGATTNIATGVVFFGAGTVTGNDNNTISNCTIADASTGMPVYSIVSTSSAGQENSNNTITTTNISNFFNASTLVSGAILLGQGNTQWNITNNRFYQTSTRTFATNLNIQRIMQITTGDGYSIAGNTIGYAAPDGTGTYTVAGAVTSRFIGIELTAGTSNTSTIQNNRVSAFSFTTSSGVSSTSITGIWCGIYVVAGNVNVTGNIVGNISPSGKVLLTPTVNGAFAVAITTAGPNSVSVIGNTIGSIALQPSGNGAGTLVAIQTIGTNGNVTVADNNIGNGTENGMIIGIAGSTTQTGISRGILNTNTGTVNITGNIIRNLINNGTGNLSLFRGIESQAGTGSISKNILSDISTGGISASFSTQIGIGILVNSTTTGIVIDSNVIYNLSLTTAGTSGAVLSGIFAGNASATTGIVNGLTITRNKIYGLSNANSTASLTSPATIAGIYCGNNNAANPLTIANNMISIGNGQATNTAVIGIFSHYANAQNYTARIYHNTVNISGTVTTGAQPSFCYYRGDFNATTASAVPTVDIKNNIFTNSRTGGTGKHYAIANSYPVAASNATGWAANASDYNVLVSSTPGTTGYWNGDVSFTDWQLNSAGDANSISGVTVNYVNPANDLHLQTGTNTAIADHGTPLAAVTIDIDKELRNTVAPDMGADEFVDATLPLSMLYFKAQKNGTANMLQWKISCNTAYVIFEVQRSIDGRNFTTLTNIQATRDRCTSPFEYADNNPAKGINYYRLKIKEANGAVVYSAIVALLTKERGFALTAITPSIVKNTATVSVSSNNNTVLSMNITDVSGRVIHSQVLNIAAGAYTVPLNVHQLAKGMYHLTVTNDKGEIQTFRFIKQ